MENVNLESGHGGLRQGEFVVLRDVVGDLELLQAWNDSLISCQLIWKQTECSTTRPEIHAEVGVVLDQLQFGRSERRQRPLDHLQNY